MAEPYLFQLAIELANGVACLPVEVRTRHAKFLRSLQNDDGGFPGRQGGSDLYYTGFGLRGLAVLDSLSQDVCQRAAGFLRASLSRQSNVVDFFSLLYSAVLIRISGGLDVFAATPPEWDERVAQMLETFRTADGGYAKAAGNASGSTYHTFLVALCYQLLGRSVPRPDDAMRFVFSRRREDGGFVEIGPMRRSGTNPTAAAVGVLQIIDGAALTTEVRDGVVAFLLEMPSIEGGFRANGRAPLADLLSTFTALWTLHRLGGADRVDLSAMIEFVDQLGILRWRLPRRPLG